MSRRPVIAGNWKMHKLQAESVELINGLMAELSRISRINQRLDGRIKRYGQSNNA